MTTPWLVTHREQLILQATSPYTRIDPRSRVSLRPPITPFALRLHTPSLEHMANPFARASLSSRLPAEIKEQLV
jgi:hypothetical protein